MIGDNAIGFAATDGPAFSNTAGECIGNLIVQLFLCFFHMREQQRIDIFNG